MRRFGRKAHARHGSPACTRRRSAAASPFAGGGRAGAASVRAMTALPALSRATAPDPAIDALPERIVQFGEGNFLRAFVDWMVDVANRRGLAAGRVVVVQPIARGMVADLNAQDCRYHLAARGVADGKVQESLHRVASISRGLDPYTQWHQFLALAAQPAISVVVSNTTEAGIAYTAEPRPVDTCPQSFPAKACAFLHARFAALGDTAATGLLFLPCELIEANGTTLRDCVLRHAEAWNLGPAFIDWVKEHNRFCNTLVDRIVPGYPKAEADELCRRAGFADKLVVAAEHFHLWVIEGDPALAERLPLHQAGLEVVWAQELAPYRTRKVRVLNGAHTMMVLAAFLAGRDTVKECLDDALVGGFLRAGVFDEILPSLDLPAQEKQAYAAAVLERFANPFIRHELLSISLNSVSKWAVRVLPSLEQYRARTGKLPQRLAFSLAALIAFYRGTPAADGSLTGSRAGAPYPIRDDAPVLAAFGEHWTAHAGDPAALARAVCADQRLWKRDLTAIPGLGEAVGAHLGRILAEGMTAALRPLAQASAGAAR